MTKKNLLGLTIEELKAFIAELGEASFRSKQLFKWINRGVTDFEEMTDFSKSLRVKLSETAYIGGVNIIKAQKDKGDGTHKFLYELEDGNAVEGVFMKYKYGNSLCVSSQVGCKMGCKFCASALDGFVRNTREMLICKNSDQKLGLVATGGFSGIITPHCRNKFTLDQNLTLRGIAVLYYLNISK